MPDKALAGYKVVSLGHHIAGPYCAKLLAGLGAEVIKVEKPGEGDPARRVGSFYQDDPHAEKSLLFLHLNTGKKSITLNLKTELGKKIFKELVSEADILVENFSPRVMPSLALDYRTLERINPRLVMASISNFGQTGPYRDYKASDLTLMAMGGLMWCHGEPDREPLTFPGWQAQYMGGCHGFYGSMAALYHAQMTGEGQQVDVSIMECTGAVSESYDIRAQITGELLGRTGNRMHGYAAWGLYPCKDGYVGLVYATAARWMQMAKMMEQPALADIEFFSQRRGRADEIDAYMLPWLMEHTKDEIYHIGQAVMRPEVATMPVRSPEDILNSPQFRAREFFVEVEHPVTGRALYPGGPVSKLSETPFQLMRSPLLGEHNEEIYCERLGYTKADLLRMKGNGVI